MGKIETYSKSTFIEKKKKKKKKRKENIRLGRDTSPIEFEEVISGLWHNWNF